MRNLKKTLCLALALVFVLGLCTVGAVNGTTFSDAEEIQYETAVTAMSGLGILIGNDDDGDGVAEYSPKGELSRAAAAKMIAYMILGESADSYPSIQVFDDVTADDPSVAWAMPYVAFCQNNGIIAGYGNGKFGPKDPVTQAQFCKMLLSACGYNAKKELEGDGWDQQTAKRAMQTKILKNLKNVDWSEPATREEAALLTYNTLMTVEQVVLSSNTNDYEAKKIVAGGGTFAEAAWDLVTDTGYVVENKANNSAAGGTVLFITDSTDWAQSPADSTFITPDDDNADLLGHEVKITYRVETNKGVSKAIAYFVDDECYEVAGGKALASVKVARNAAFQYGELGAIAFPADKTDANTYPGVYVINGQGQIVAYKETGFFIANLQVAAGATKVADFYNAGTPVTVTAPADAKADDIVIVTKCGDNYAAELATKKDNVAITQSAQNASTGLYSYNDGAIVASAADNAGANLIGFTAGFDGTATAPAQLLDLNYSYTLYFDTEGACIGWANKVQTGETVSATYVMYVADWNEQVDAGYGATVTKYYAQVISAEGKIENLTLDAATSGLTRGDICVVTPTLSGNKALAAAPVTEALADTYAPADPAFDFSNATFIWVDGGDGTTPAPTLAALTSKKVSTALTPDKGTAIRYTFEVVKNGTVNVQKVSTVWFDVKPADVVVIPDSYIYVVSSDVKETRVNAAGGLDDYYSAYLDGAVMSDLIQATAPTIGFNTYTKSSTGYKLTPATTADGVTYISLKDETKDNPYAVETDTTAYILGNKLYVPTGDTTTKFYSVDISSVAFVKLGLAAYNTVNVSTAAALENAISNGYKFNLVFVNRVEKGVHSAAGAVIYITGIVNPA